MRDVGNIKYHTHVVAVALLLTIFITPSIVATRSFATLDQEYYPTANDVEPQLPKVDAQLMELINNQEKGNFKVIVVLTNPNDLMTIERIIGQDSSFKLITTFKIIPAVLIEGPLNKISELYSINTIRSIYLNRQYKLEPLNETGSLALSRFPASPWLQRINITGLRSTYAGAGVNVAVADSGIDASHPDLSGKVIAWRSFVNASLGYPYNDTSSSDDNGHGTYVAGIIAGTGAVEAFYEGVAPSVTLISAKCIDQFGEGFTAGIIKAIEWAVSQGCDVINLSLGGGSADPDDPMSLAVDNAVRSGVVAVAAAGNEGPYYSTGSVPGAARLAISVGALDVTDSLADFSSKGPTLDGRAYPDVLAPGVNIVSTLAGDSGIYYYAGRLGLTDGNYVSLSGTSASAPIVSGSVALLLSTTALNQLRRSVVPNQYKIEIATTIRIALMNTARNLGSDVNSLGSGIIDVGAAYTYLLHFGARLHYPIANVYPKNLINPPYFVGYLGDSIGPTVSLLTATETNLTITTSGNASSFIQLSDWGFTDIVGLTSLKTNVSIPVNAVLGDYTGNILFRNATSGQFVGNVSVGFSVRIPKGRLYFDLYHNTESVLSITSALYKLSSALTSLGYSVHESNAPITFPAISQYDILVLTDPKMVYGAEEVKAIHEFVQRNGSLLVLGTYYPNLASEAINSIIGQYGIQFERNIVADYSEVALANIPGSMISITNLFSHPITNGVSSYQFGYGSSLLVNNPAVSLAFAPPRWGDSAVLAAFDSPVGGRIVVSGGMVFATGENLLSSSYPGNLKLTENIVNWLLNETNVSIEVATPTTRAKAGEPLQIGAMVVNRTSGDLLTSLSLSCEVYNGSWADINLINSGGIYYNTSVILQSEGFYMFKVNSSYSGQEISRTFFIEIVNSPPQISEIVVTTYPNPLIIYPLPTYYQSFLPDGTPMISRFGDYVNFTITVSGVNSVNSNVTVYLTRQPYLYTPNNKYLTYVTLRAERLNQTTYVAKFLPTLGNSTDVYLYWISANNNSHMSLFNQVNMIVVASIDPELNESLSTINGKALSDFGLYEYMTVNIGDTLSIVVNGTDVEDDQAHTRSNMRAWAVLLDPTLYLVPGFIEAELVTSQVPYNSIGNAFTGTITIPSSGYVDSLVSETPLSLTNNLFALFLILVDSDGAYSASYAYVWIVNRVEPPILLILGLLSASVAIPILIILFIPRKSKARVTEGPPPDYYDNPS